MLSIIIPTWNNLPYLKLCVQSIQRHTAVPHEIILHINDGSDGTLDWARTMQIPYTFSSTNLGICYGVNMAASLATRDNIVYMNDDMYCCPGWDQAIADEIGSIPESKYMLSATLIEPADSGNPCVVVADYGRTTDSFREKDLLLILPTLQKHDWNGASWPPCVIPRPLWHLVGGFSIEFSPGMGSDDDLSRKLWQSGCRYFKGLGNSFVYHFQSKSTKRIIRNNGRREFLQKWDLSISTFNRYFLRRGSAFAGPLHEPDPSTIQTDKIKNWLKKKFIY